jgi:hypothetical protein
MDYASYLEARPEFAYLRPAWNYIEPFFEQDCNRALDRAVSVAGFR